MHEKRPALARARNLGAALISSLLWLDASAQPIDKAPLTKLRDCVAQAANPKSVTAFEQREQAALRKRIAILGAAIVERLDARDRQLFDRNRAAWQAYFDSEEALLRLTLERRTDGLGPTLHLGGVNRLYAQRERQLREHLHNLNQAHKRLRDRP